MRLRQQVVDHPRVRRPGNKARLLSLQTALPSFGDHAHRSRQPQFKSPLIGKVGT
jgi:hypothetical protein